MTMARIVKIGSPNAAMSGTESAEMNPPPMNGRVNICR